MPESRENGALRALLLMLVIVAPSICVAQVYRSVAPDGTVTYSDVPSAPGAKIVQLAITEPTDSQRRANDAPASSRPTRTGAKHSNDARPGRPTNKNSQLSPQQAKKVKTQRCKRAQDRARRYSVAHRLYRTLPNGERKYLSDDEIDTARAKAATAVQRWCG